MQETVSGCSVAGKSRLDCATGAAILALPSMRIRFARAVELKVPGDFFSSLWMPVLLCLAYVEILCALELLHQSDVFYSSVLQVYCVSQLSLCRSQWHGCVKIPAVAACVILLCFAAESES